MKTQTKKVPKLRFREFSDEWQEMKLGDLLKIGSGRDYKHLQKGDIPVYGTGGLMLRVNDYLYDGKSICIGRKGTIDKPRFLNGKFWTVDTLFYTYDFNNSVPEFLYLIFLKINWQKYNEASGVPSLSKTTIEKIKTKVPTKQEQKKIAEFLTTVDEKIEKLQKRKELLEKYKKGAIQAIFSQKIRFKDENGKDYSDWQEKKLGNIASVYQPVTISQSVLTHKGYPVYGANGIIGKYTKFNHELEQIAVTCRGNTCGTINWTKPMAWITGNAMVINTDESKEINKKFLYFQLNNQRLDYLITGSGQPQITGDIKKHKVLIPDIQEQQKIADFLTSLDDRINLTEKELEQAKNFKKALLQQMFV